MSLPPVVGADGRFDPIAYAAHGAMTADEPYSMNVALSENIADLIEQDEFGASYDQMVEAEMRARAYRSLPGKFDPRYFDDRLFDPRHRDRGEQAMRDRSALFGPSWPPAPDDPFSARYITQEPSESLGLYGVRR
jgi:hypothetical protein